MDEDLAVLEILATTNASITLRYIETGFSRPATSEALARTAKSLNDSVRSALRKAGRPVR